MDLGCGPGNGVFLLLPSDLNTPPAMKITELEGEEYE
jgi:hypothetical protein